MKELPRKRKSSYQNEMNAKKSKSDEESPEELRSLVWLRNNQRPFEEVKKNWKVTSLHRRNWLLKNPRPEVETVLRDWPILELPIARALIHMDFKNLRLTDFILTEEKWEKFFTVVQKEKKIAKKDDFGHFLNTRIQDVDTTKDGRIVAQISLLPHYITQRGGTTRGSNEGRTISSITKDIKDTLIQVVTTERDVSGVKPQGIEAERLGMQPYIVVVGTNPQAPTNFYVYVKDHKYPVKSALEALTLCFEIYHVFDSQYPVLSQKIWMLLQRGLFNIKTKSDIRMPSLSPLLKKIREAQTSEKSPEAGGNCCS